MGFREYKWSDACKKQVAGFGFEHARARDMARQSAPYTHPKWNRRFEEWVLRIEGSTVVEFGPAPAENDRTRETPASRCTVCRGSMKMTFYEDHDDCDGKGCHRCEDGQVRVERRCPTKRGANEVCSDALDTGR